MENLIDYLVPLIVILSFLSFRAKRKKAKEEAPVKPKKEGFSLFGKLNRMMEEYYESDLKGAPHRKSDDSEPWEDDPWEVNPKYQETRPEENQVDEPEPQTVPKVEPEAGKRQDKRVQPIVVAPITPKPASADYSLGNVSKQDLRKAIVWSEILGPPIALREK